MNRSWALVAAMIFLGIAALISSLVLADAVSDGAASMSNQLHRMQEAMAQASPDKVYNEDLLLPAEAAAFLGVEEYQLKQMVVESRFVDGKGIPYLKIKGELRFSKQALADWIQHSAENHLEY